MSIADIVRRAGRSLRQAKARTLLTSLAIAVGAFTLTLSLAAGQGAREYADALISSNTDTQEIYVSKTSQEQLFDTTTPREFSEDSASFAAGQLSVEQVTDKDVTKIAQQEGVAEATPSYRPSIRYITREGEKRYSGSISMFGPSSAPELAAGSVTKDDKLGKYEIIVSDKYAEVLGFKNPKDALGQMVTINLRRAKGSVQTLTYPPQMSPLYEEKNIELKIVGVSTQGSTALSSPVPLLIAPVLAKEMTLFTTEGTEDEGKYLAVIAQVEDGKDVEEVKSALEAKGYEVETAKDIQGVLFTIVNVLQGITLGFGVLAIIASVFGIINTQYISVLERTQQIGLMKALGMRRRDISRLFRLEAAWIGFLGGTIGAALAWAAGTALNPWLSETIGLGDHYLLVFQLPAIVGLVVALVAVAIVAGILPARKAAKLDPIEALRTE